MFSAAFRVTNKSIRSVRFSSKLQCIHAQRSSVHSKLTRPTQSSIPIPKMTHSTSSHDNDIDTDEVRNQSATNKASADNSTLYKSAHLQDPLSSPTYFASYDALRDLCTNNVEFFRKDDSEAGQRFLNAYIGLLDHIETARGYVGQIKEFAHEYDFSAESPGNGYRSFLLVVRSCIAHSLKLSSHVMQSRGSLLFRKNLYMKEVESCCHLLASLCTCLQHLVTLREWSEPGSLFPQGVHTATDLFAMADSINQYSFYGRCLGVQYCESMQSSLRFLSVCMASFSEVYYKEGTTFTKTTASMWTSGKYYLNPELRARRIVNISQNAEIDFCKSFWSLAEGELMQALPTVLGTTIKVNRVIDIATEPLQLPHFEDSSISIDIPIPSSHIGSGPVSARLLSATRRIGMIGEKNKSGNAQSPSKSLIFHCHGGGFVAQSSKSHEIYLRDWAVALDVPILSIDYSLSPNAPFPRAIEEVFYAYCWAIKNCALLGTTAENIVLAGDSAGANLSLACALRCIEMNVRRPTGIFLAYCPVQFCFSPSPARLLCLMDPLLPFGFMMRCLKAYACPSQAIIEQNKQLVAEQEAIKKASSPVVVSGSESDKPTFVDVTQPPCDEASTPMDGSSLWEHIEHDFDQQNQKSPGSDGTSDTFASASLHSHNTQGNTEMMTPDESNGESLEEDSQPITIHRPIGEVFDKEKPCLSSELELVSIGKPDESLHDTPATAKTAEEVPTTKTEGSEYVNQIVQRYVLDVDGGSDKPVLVPVPGTTKSEEAVIMDAISVQSLHQKITQVMDTVASSVSNKLQSMTASTPIRECQEFAGVRRRLDAMEQRSPTEEFLFEVPRDPLLSPYYATDEVLAQLPTTHILTVDMDPCLDDCVMFAKRLQTLNKRISLDVLPGLPHGFLNFVKVSKEAHAGNKVCVHRLGQLLNQE